MLLLARDSGLHKKKKGEREKNWRILFVEAESSEADLLFYKLLFSLLRMIMSCHLKELQIVKLKSCEMSFTSFYLTNKSVNTLK